MLIAKFERFAFNNNCYLYIAKKQFMIKLSKCNMGTIQYLSLATCLQAQINSGENYGFA